MKSVIFKKFSTIGKIERMQIFVLGICIYSEEWPQEDLKPRKVGFNQFNNDAPGFIDDEDDWDDD